MPSVLTTSLPLLHSHSNYVLRMKDDISDGVGLPDWRLTLCLLFSWLVLFLTLAKGVKSSGKVGKHYFATLYTIPYRGFSH